MMDLAGVGLTVLAVLVVAALTFWLLRPRSTCCWCGRLRRGCRIVRGGVVCRACARKHSAPGHLLGRRR